MSATSSYLSLATHDSYLGDAGSTEAPGVGEGNDAGAAGDSSANSITISTGGMVAIIIVVAIVTLVGSKKRPKKSASFGARNADKL